MEIGKKGAGVGVGVGGVGVGVGSVVKGIDKGQKK